MKAAFVLDPSRCTGCEACRVACCVENQVPMERSWRAVHRINTAHAPGTPSFHLSMACNHCDHPACLKGCPALAYRRDEATGAVLIDDSVCIGCQYCSWVCPYGAPQFDPSRGVMTKCTFCAHRLADDRAPACATSCPTGALAVKPRALNPPDAQLPGFTELGLGPALQLISRGLENAPEVALAPMAKELLCTQSGSEQASGLRQHWTLLPFTFMAILLVSIFSAWLLTRQAILPIWSFALLGGSAAGLSALHLGRPDRAWRAVRNLRHSWLSREVFAFGAFLPMASLCMWFNLRGPAAVVVLFLGTFLLVAIDRLYQVAEGLSWREAHAAGALLTALYLTGLFSSFFPLAGFAAAAKLILTARNRDGSREPLRGSLSFLRFAGPILVILGALLPWARGQVIGLIAIVAEFVARADFYQNLSLVGCRTVSPGGNGEVCQQGVQNDLGRLIKDGLNENAP